MISRNYAVGVECKKMLEEAARRHLPIKVTNRRGYLWQVYNSNFLGLQSGRLALASPKDNDQTEAIEPTQGQEIAVSFKKGYHKCLFVTRILNCGQFEIEPGVSAPAMTVLAPQQVEKVQRRAFNRAAAPAGEPVIVSFAPSWQDPDTSPALSGHARLHDLSAGGLGLVMPLDKMPKLKTGDQFKLCFVPWPGQEPIHLEARFRHATEPDQNGNVILGLQIVGLEMTEEGRGRLRRIGRVVGVYNRREPIGQHLNLMHQ